MGALLDAMILPSADEKCADAEALESGISVDLLEACHFSEDDSLARRQATSCFADLCHE